MSGAGSMRWWRSQWRMVERGRPPLLRLWSLCCRFGSYRVVTVKLDATKSREELLEMRSKMKSDKFC